MKATRREFLIASAAASLGAASKLYAKDKSQAVAQVPRLKDVAAAVGVHFGAGGSDPAFSGQPPAYGQLFVDQCALGAVNFSWKHANPDSPDVTVWEDPNISFFVDHKMKLTGGHLIWHLHSPKWIADMPAPQAEKAIQDHIALVGAKYGKNMYSWNVCNETIRPTDGRPDGFRKMVYLDKFGMDYYDFSAHAAKEAAPDVLRVYNDYGMDMDTAENETRRRLLLKLLDEFKKRGTPIEAVGLQTHIRLNKDKFDEEIYRKFLKEIADRGFKILITEMDVFDFDTPPAINTRDQMVAEMYSRVLTTALDEKALKAVVTWGLVDKYTWLSPTYSASYHRADNLPSRPLPFDNDLKPKPAFTAIYEAFLHAPHRDA